MVSLDRLRRNDSTYTELVFYKKDFLKSDNFLDLVTAILTNTFVDTVRFHSCAYPKWSPKQVSLLFSALARLPKLQLLSITQTTVPLQALAVVLGKAFHLGELDVRDTTIVGTQKDVHEFEDALSGRPIHAAGQYTVLYAKNVRFGNDLVNLDPFLSSIFRTFDDITFERVHWRTKQGQSLSSESIFQHTALVPKSSRLTLRQMPLSDDQVEHLATGLKTSALEGLHLSDITLSDTSMKLLADALQSNRKLKSLTLAKCCLSDAGARHLSAMLNVNTSLQTLTMPQNEIGDKGAIALSRALQVAGDTSAIKSLDLRGNVNILHKGIEVMVALADRSRTLQSIQLFGARNYGHNDMEKLEIQQRINCSTSLNCRNSRYYDHQPRKRSKIWYE